MIYGNVELHNCVETWAGNGFVGIQRVPEAVRGKLNANAQVRMRQPASAEIRFHLPPGASARVTLASEGLSHAVVYFGDSRHSDLILIGQEPRTIEIGWTERLQMHVDRLREQPHTFDPALVRVRMGGGVIHLHGVEGDGIRLPAPGEVPTQRYMAYGTSITHESHALAPHLTYVARVARLLGVDFLNFGVGGACHCEPELADYIGAREDWDFGTLALSVNMMGFECDEFEKRVRYMVNTVAGANPARPVACITLYRYYGDLNPNIEEKARTFRRILGDAVADCPTPNAHLLQGPDLLQHYGGLMTDLLHPSDDGMIEIAANLANALKPLVRG